MEIQDRYNPAAIRDLFNEMSATYGAVNLISSFGFTLRWRNQALRNIPIAETSHVVDLMSGMNELCRSLSHHSSSGLHVTAVDISPEMAHRARKDWPFHVETKVEDVLAWNFESGSADAVISSFGLKTFDPNQQLQCWFYMFYLNRIIPWIGRLFLGNPLNYQMLGIYTQDFGSCRHFAECLQQQGLQVRTVSYFFGCATCVCGTKPFPKK